MEATSLCSSLLPPSLFSSHKLHSQNRKFGHVKRPPSVIVSAARKDSWNYKGRGRLVDESMIVLRKRIHEMKMIERNYEPPAEWMEWEKQCYACYDELICNAVGMLQSQLMNCRPSLALGMLALITLSVPASSIMIVLRLLEAANGVPFSAIHFS